MQTLVDQRVALTSTLTVFEAGMPDRPVPPGVDVLLPSLKALFPKAMQLEREFVRAGGMLVAGTDPTGGGGVIPGFSNQRQLELLVEAGFTPLEAIRRSFNPCPGASEFGDSSTDQSPGTEA